MSKSPSVIDVDAAVAIVVCSVAVVDVVATPTTIVFITAIFLCHRSRYCSYLFVVVAVVALVVVASSHYLGSIGLFRKLRVEFVCHLRTGFRYCKLCAKESCTSDSSLCVSWGTIYQT